jgi:putative membrane protein
MEAIMWWDDYWWMSDHWPMPWMFFGPIMLIVFISMCAAMMFFMMRDRRHRGSYALDILKERFARGEINQAEYEERRRLLDT